MEQNFSDSLQESRTVFLAFFLFNVITSTPTFFTHVALAVIAVLAIVAIIAILTRP